jgi:hypothetical protein
LKKYIIEQLRKFSYIPGKEKTLISKLEDEQLFNLYLMLRSGATSRSIASVLQKTLNKGEGSSIHSIAQGITTFKKRIAHLLVEVPVTPDLTTIPQQINEGDFLKRMEAIADKCEERIKRIMEQEASTGIRYPYLNRDIQTLASLRKSILKLKEWELKYRDPLRELAEKERAVDRVMMAKKELCKSWTSSLTSSLKTQSG